MRDNEELDTSFFKIVNENHERAKAKEAKAKAEEAKQQGYVVRKPSNLRNEPKYNDMKPSNLRIRRKALLLVKALLAAGLCLVLVAGAYKLIAGIVDKNSTDNKQDTGIVTMAPEEIRTIGIEDCNLSNVHIILRAAKNDTIGVVNVCHDEFDALGVSNERIRRDDDIVAVVQNAKESHPGCEIVVMNIETGVEHSDNYRTIIMTDGKNNKVNTADTLVACMNTSFMEYDLSPDVRSGKFNSNLGLRTETSIEKQLREAGLEEGVTQFTVDLTGRISSDEITRNDCASAIVEGTMRWGALGVSERHDDVYYMVGYGDTLSEIAETYHTSVDTIKTLSDLWETPTLGADWTVTVNEGPSTASTSTKVNNPTVTTNPNEVGIVTYSYIVSPGDTLSEIADDYGVPMSSIHPKSGDPNKIQAGEVLTINKTDFILTSPKVDLNKTSNKTY